MLEWIRKTFSQNFHNFGRTMSEIFMSARGLNIMNQSQRLREAKNHINVIFIHGINSSEECWKNKNGSYWPDLLKADDKLADIGIYIFVYRTGLNTGSYSLSDVVDYLREYFSLNGLINSSGIIFVCHSMGGIIARQFLVNEQSDFIKRGLDKIKIGLFLVASPSLGSDYANMISLISSAIGHTQATALQFSQSNIWLNDLDKNFINLKEKNTIRIKGKELIEDLPLYGKGLFKKQIVQPFLVQSTLVIHLKCRIQIIFRLLNLPTRTRFNIVC
jgi:hypothetical protein